MPDIISIGEMIIDFIPSIKDTSIKDVPSFSKAAGGAPANVAVGLAKLGVSSGFIGKIGADHFGDYLLDTLKTHNVDTTAVVRTSEAKTGLAFVSLRADGEREFVFYRDPSADMLLEPDELPEDWIRSAQMLHFGSISLISEPSRSATIRAIDVARRAGAITTYDPNLRLHLWPDEQAARAGLIEPMALADVVKLSLDEVIFLTGSDDVFSAASTLWKPGMKLMVITLGAMGCAYLTNEFQGEVPGYAVKSIDTTGAGDGFSAGLLKILLEAPDAFNNQESIRLACSYANAVGAMVSAASGAIPALPTAAQVTAFRN